MLLLAAALVGIGSAVFHPESSRVARMASGGRHGLAQSLFQVGGNAGSALGPLLAAFIVLPRGQRSVAWFSLAALLGDRDSVRGRRAGTRRITARARRPAGARRPDRAVPARIAETIGARASCMALIFSKYFYLASLTSYYTFYLIAQVHVSVQTRADPPVRFPGRGGRRARSSAARSATASAAST